MVASQTRGAPSSARSQRRHRILKSQHTVAFQGRCTRALVANVIVGKAPLGGPFLLRTQGGPFLRRNAPWLPMSQVQGRPVDFSVPFCFCSAMFPWRCTRALVDKMTFRQLFVFLSDVSSASASSAGGAAAGAPSTLSTPAAASRRAVGSGGGGGVGGGGAGRSSRVSTGAVATAPNGSLLRALLCACSRAYAHMRVFVCVCVCVCVRACARACASAGAFWACACVCVCVCLCVGLSVCLCVCVCARACLVHALMSGWVCVC